ncbi:hypothetical protein NA56DRAFT_743224 [Hyaloscypha hepaticicola]|uniref:Uncharacterized protein n=1 Tax=Hyaloscypha hepaticicola TaxID=2082293 RepID=A0A2J6QNV0_9HELO|nr:hypothetical protein NA56DRAFT_743224 [Hyaloscypha hepaticicola]
MEDNLETWPVEIWVMNATSNGALFGIVGSWRAVAPEQLCQTMHSVPNIKSSDAVPDHQDQIDPEPNNLLLLSVSTIQSLRLSWTPSPFEALLNQFLTPTRGFDSLAGGQICRSLDEPCVNVSAFMLLTRLSTALLDTIFLNEEALLAPAGSKLTNHYPLRKKSTILSSPLRSRKDNQQLRLHICNAVQQRLTCVGRSKTRHSAQLRSFARVHILLNIGKGPHKLATPYQDKSIRFKDICPIDPVEALKDLYGQGIQSAELRNWISTWPWPTSTLTLKDCVSYGDRETAQKVRLRVFPRPNCLCSSSSSHELWITRVLKYARFSQLILCCCWVGMDHLIDRLGGVSAESMGRTATDTESTVFFPVGMLKGGVSFSGILSLG